MLKNTMLVLLLGLAAFTLYLAVSPSSAPPGGEFTTLAGKSFSFGSLRGQPVLVTFWATDCPSCLKEIPDLIDLYRSFHAQGLAMVAINMYYDPPNRVFAMVEEQHIPYDVVLDIYGRHAHEFGNVQLTPTTFLFDAGGRQVFQKTGSFDTADLKQRIKQLLKG